VERAFLSLKILAVMGKKRSMEREGRASLFDEERG